LSFLGSGTVILVAGQPGDL